MISTKYTIYEASDPGEAPPERRFVCLIALSHLGDVHAIHYGETYDDTLAKAEEIWEKHVSTVVGKVDKRKTRDPMVRLAKVLADLEAVLRRHTNLEDEL